MSSTAMMDSYDTPMFDFDEDSDIAMGASSAEQWFHSPTRMEEDGQMHQDSSVNVEFSQSDGVEVDMMAYDETAECEMTDGAAEHGAYADLELLDTELDDVSVTPSLAAHSNHALEVVTEENVAADHLADFNPSPVDVSSHHPDVHQEIETGHRSGTPKSETGESASVSVGLTLATDESSSTVQQNLKDLSSHDQEASGSVADYSEHDKVANSGVQEHEHDEHGIHDNSAQPQPLSSVLSEPAEAVEPPLTLSNEADEQIDGEHRGDLPNQETVEEHGDVYETYSDPHVNPEGTYVDSPPPVLLSLRLTSTEGEQPDFTLFSLPEAEPTNTTADAKDLPSSAVEEPLILLQHRPSLYYEPMSAVFEALRQEEYFSHLEDLVEAEMALNAYDIQLIVSEDNVYAREVSLHDLNALHDGIGLTGPLRVALQSVVPRFITRYNILRDQMTRMTLTAERPEEEIGGEEDAEGEDEYPEDEEVPAEGAVQDVHAAKSDPEIQQSNSLEGHDSPTHLNVAKDTESHQNQGITSTKDSSSTDQPAAEHTADGEELETPANDGDPVLGEESVDHDSNDDLRGDTLDPGDINSAEESGAFSHTAVEGGSTEYDDVAEHLEDGEEGYDEEFADGEVENNSTTGETESTFEHADNSHHVAFDEDSLPPDVEAGHVKITESSKSELPDSRHAIHQLESHTTSPHEDEHNTDHYSHSKHENSEGNDNVGAINDEAFEGAFLGSPEEDAASEAALLESEQFLEMLEKENDGTGSVLDLQDNADNNVNDHESSGQDLASANILQSVESTSLSDTEKRQKPTQRKRSLAQTDLEEQSEGSPPSSPGSKRFRVQ